LPLRGVGIDGELVYCTAEIVGLAVTTDGATLTLCAPPSGEVELQIAGESEPRVLRGGEQVQAEVNGRTLQIIVEAIAKFAEPAPVEAIDVLQLPRKVWDIAETSLGEARSGDAVAMEHHGVLRGAAWYEAAFDTDHDVNEITLPAAGDLMTVYVDASYAGTFLSDGSPLPVKLPAPLPAGRHVLRCRTEVWGHANFDESRWPSGRLGSLRGLHGAIGVDGNPIAAEWHFGEESSPPLRGKLIEQPAMTVGGGEYRLLEILLPPVGSGAVLNMEGMDCHGEIFVGDMVLARFAFGPTLPVKMVGGPGNRFYLPAALVRDGAAIVMVLRGVGSGGTITSMTLRGSSEAADAE
jgi:hypothetical protein